MRRYIHGECNGMPFGASTRAEEEKIPASNHAVCQRAAKGVKFPGPLMCRITNTSNVCSDRKTYAAYFQIRYFLILIRTQFIAPNTSSWMRWISCANRSARIRMIKRWSQSGNYSHLRAERTGASFQCMSQHSSALLVMHNKWHTRAAK